MSMLDKLSGMLAAGQDNALLRYTLGSEHLKAGNHGEAVPHLRAAVVFDPGYSAAWKLLGKALAAAGEHDAAIVALDEGIRVAQDRGDIQAAKEMQVFRRRSVKALSG